MELKKKLPLFIVTGASGVGKSTLCQILFENETEYVVMESDLLWQECYNTPEDNYQQYRELWLRLCANISQIGKPVVLCGCAMPEHFEKCAGRELFSRIHYLAVVCSEENLEKRLRSGRGVNDEGWIQGSLDFNAWLKENATKTEPNMQLLDTTGLTPEEAAAKADKWMISSL